MHIEFRSLLEEQPAEKWQALFAETWPSYHGWFLKEGEAARPSYLTCRGMMRRHMPELIPMWERLIELGDGGDHLARMLSLYRPSPFAAGCSQALWSREEPILVRNYDYHPLLCEGVLLLSRWHDRWVVATSDTLWGVLDGMNEAGLAVTLAFGGRRKSGDGFAITLALRYVLEFCDTVDEAVRQLDAIPCHMSYTVGLLDATGEHRTVYLNPDRPLRVVERPYSTNHQDEVDWPEHDALTGSRKREDFLRERMDDPDESPERFVERFLEDPLFNSNYSRAFGTLYTAIYRPRSGQMQYRWRDHAWTQSFDSFNEQSIGIAYEES